jgi:redox-sensitive bicupin YhaK (pirin superfamily)
MITIRLSNARGHASHGWLESYHTFSFAEYNDAQHVGFRSLRVINEDRVQGGEGFDMHPHRDFEILSYVISGGLKHEDCMGNTAVIKAGEVQHISAGTGIEHSEYNNSRVDLVHFIQIWLVPCREGLVPHYTQETFANAPSNDLTLACSVDGRNKSIKINQDAELYIGKLAPGGEIYHRLQDERYAWIQVITGDLELNTKVLSAGDGASVSQEPELRCTSQRGAHFLLFDLN